MKHFIVEINYLVPLERIQESVPRHRAYLQLGYDAGLLLCSGPKVPATGGFMLARAESLAALQAFFEQDPFHIEKLASFRFSEFNPVKRQGWAEAWFAEPSAA
ncbi:YciI family protein [uncultured Variovorax sp.]|uniref:YciI family protein n=1 Tax=uncultured Variovorax sp. TaxID=114708 RepID=UPI0025E7F01B|nr:YciI family protein [uncultured Variovorax sp.]